MNANEAARIEKHLAERGFGGTRVRRVGGVFTLGTPLAATPEALALLTEVWAEGDLVESLSALQAAR